MEILYSKSEAKVIIKNSVMKEWQHNMDIAVTGRHYERIQEKAGSRSKGNNKIGGIITRLRMGHTGLNKTLHLIEKHPCDHFQDEKSAEHFCCITVKSISQKEIY